MPLTRARSLSVASVIADDTFAGPRQLPLLEVDDNLSFFSSNAAAQYLFPVVDVTDHGECQQTQEWEATRLHPAVSAVLTSKTVASDLKQVLQALLSTVNGTLEKHKYILGDKLSPADISIWSTLYPLYHKDELKQAYIADCAHILRCNDFIGIPIQIESKIEGCCGG
uniref:Nuclear-export cofactor Arc1-like N-terminal domain-containing protein n=1 Tax=Heliothis virescens TaxID=7102 RepID=A0A2A4J6N7_HELVI